MAAIRKMTTQDVDQVRRVEAAGFSGWWKRLQGEAAVLPLRTRQNILSCLEKDPDGCFVTEQDGRVVGFIFSRTWGRVGWFGTFAVLPEHQAGGIGKTLMAASLGYLRSAQLSVIGLETMPDVPNNIGLYLSQGFQAHYPTLLLTRSLTNGAATQSSLLPWSSAGEEQRLRWLVDLREAAGALPPGFDYSKEILATHRYTQGETLLLMHGERAVGMSVVLPASSREDSEADPAGVYVLALHPVYTDEGAFRALIAGSEAYAFAHGKKSLALWVNARYAWALKQLLEMDYRVERLMQRMVLEGMSEGPQDEGLVNLNRWAG